MDKTVQGLKAELERLEDELDYQVSHKRIAALQQRIDEIEKEIEEQTRKNICSIDKE